MDKMMLKKQYMMYSPKKSSSRLPSDFQEVEYIEKQYSASNSSYFDSGIPASNDLVVEAELFNEIGTTDGACAVFGSRVGFKNKDYTLNFTNAVSNGTKYDSRFGSNAYNYGSYLVEYPKNYHILTWGNGEVKINGETKLAMDNTSFQSTLNVFLFAGNSNGSVGFFEGSGKTKVKWLKMTKNGVLVRNFIPCYRKSDNEIGMYDIVTNTFFTNQGTGSFLCGRPLVYDTIAGYVQVDYIELKKEDRTYGSYLDIDDYIVNTSQYKTEIKFIEPSDATKYNCFGFANDGSSIVSQLGVFTSSGTRYIAFQHKTRDTVDNITFDTNWHTYYCENGGQYFDGVKKFSNSINYTTETNINKWYLFSRAVNGEVWNNGFCYIQCKYFFTYRNNKFKRILIPMRRLVDGEIGMYDLNKEVFYTDEYGTHSFTSGEVLTA